MQRDGSLLASLRELVGIRDRWLDRCRIGFFGMGGEEKAGGWKLEAVKKSEEMLRRKRSKCASTNTYKRKRGSWKRACCLLSVVCLLLSRFLNVGHTSWPDVDRCTSSPVGRWVEKYHSSGPLCGFLSATIFLFLKLVAWPWEEPGDESVLSPIILFLQQATVQKRQLFGHRAGLLRQLQRSMEPTARDDGARTQSVALTCSPVPAKSSSSHSSTKRTRTRFGAPHLGMPTHTHTHTQKIRILLWLNAGQTGLRAEPSFCFISAIFKKFLLFSSLLFQVAKSWLPASSNKFKTNSTTTIPAANDRASCHQKRTNRWYKYWDRNSFAAHQALFMSLQRHGAPLQILALTL